MLFDDPDFTGPGYRAHVTMTRTERVRSGEILDVGQAVIVDMLPHGGERLRRVVWARSLQPGPTGRRA